VPRERKHARILVSRGYICLVSKDGERFHIGRNHYGYLRYALNLSDIMNKFGEEGDNAIEVVTLK